VGAEIRIQAMAPVLENDPWAAQLGLFVLYEENYFIDPF
jgi:hypothetical protein